MKLVDGRPVSGLTRICDVEKRAPGGGGAPEVSCVDGPKPPEPASGGGEPRFVVHQGDEGWVGTRKLVAIRGPDDPLHPDYREFALAVADFAVLYDPRDRETEASVDPTAAAGCPLLDVADPGQPADRPAVHQLHLGSMSKAV